MRLDDRTVAALSCSSGRKDQLVFDPEQRGFGVRVEAGGRKTFLFQYRTGSKVRRVPLGIFGEVTAAKARKLALELRGAVAGGRDPWGERKAARVEAEAIEVRTAQRAASDAFTVRKLIDDWERLHLAHKRLSYRRDALSRLRLHLGPILDTPAQSVTKRDAVECVDRAAVAGGETTARRVQSYARSMFSWGRGRGSLEVNPFEGVPAPGREVPRERVLRDVELGLLWRASEQLPYPHGPFTRFLLLTLQRREEVAGLVWREIAADLSTWTLPGARAKNGKPNVVHLAAPARAILATAGRGEPDALVFGTIDGKGLTTFSWIKGKLDARMEEARAEAAGAGAPPPLPHWTMHDFRRSGVTWLAEAGFSPHVADRLLNHVQGTIRGVAAIYQRGEFLAERRAALDAWAEHVQACGGQGGVAANLVPLRPTSRSPNRMRAKGR